MVLIVEEFRKKQGKSQLSANLKYFMETGYKTSDSETLKVRKTACFKFNCNALLFKQILYQETDRNLKFSYILFEYCLIIWTLLMFTL